MARQTVLESLFATKHYSQNVDIIYNMRLNKITVKVNGTACNSEGVYQKLIPRPFLLKMHIRDAVYLFSCS